MQRARVVIYNKVGVFDGEAKAIEEGLVRLGYETLEGLRVGKTIELRVSNRNKSAVKAEIERMCQELLVNSVLEDYSIEFLGDES